MLVNPKKGTTIVCSDCRDKLYESYEKDYPVARFLLHSENLNDEITCDKCEEILPFGYFITVYHISDSVMR